MSGPVIIGPVRGRVQAHFRRWSSRWSTVAADTFFRVDQQGLGTSDTGHAWQVSGDGDGAWEVRAARALARGTVLDTFAHVGLPSPEVRVSARLLYGSGGQGSTYGGGATSTVGPGIVFRLASDASDGYGWMYQGAGSYELRRWINGWQAALTTAAGPSVAPGGLVTMEARVAGASATFWANGVQVDAYASVTGPGGNQHVGLFSVLGGAWNQYDRFRATRYVG